jgi:hypothetical protein
MNVAADQKPEQLDLRFDERRTHDLNPRLRAFCKSPAVRKSSPSLKSGFEGRLSAHFCSAARVGTIHTLRASFTFTHLYANSQYR